LRRKFVLAVSLLLLSAGLAVTHHEQSNKPVLAMNPLTSPEQPVIPIEIAGPLANRDSEVSGLAWYEDYLIMLPQYPERLDGHIFALAKSDIVQSLSGEDMATLEPTAIPIVTPDFANEIRGFEGFEAIAFKDNQAFLTIEAESGGSARGYVVKGEIKENLSQFTIDAKPIVESSAQSEVSNMADESILLTEDSVISIYEANGALVNEQPSVHTFDFELMPAATVAFPTIEYRITDVTELDESDRFWAINYFYPGDTALLPARDPLTIRYGRGETHRQHKAVERIVELSYGEQGVAITSTPPIQLELTEAGRNWEGIARLNDEGFLIVTDKFPKTILGFVAFPEE